MEHCWSMRRRHQDGTNWPVLLTLGIAVALGLRIWSVWSQLPDTMGSHFGISGRADSFMSKESFFVVMVLIGGGSIATVFAARIWIRRLPPSLVNLPNRDYWLATDERRETAIGRIGSLLDWTGMATAALLALAIELAMRANLHQTNFDNATFMVVFVAYFVFIFAIFFRKIRLLRVPEGSES